MNIIDFEEGLKNHKFDELPIEGAESAWQDFLSNQTMNGGPVPKEVSFWKNWKKIILAACVVGSIIAFFFSQINEPLSPIKRHGISMSIPSTIESKHKSSALNEKSADDLATKKPKIEGIFTPIFAKKTDVNKNNTPTRTVKKGYISVNETNSAARSSKILPKTKSKKEEITRITIERPENFEIESNPIQKVESDEKPFAETTASPTFIANLEGIQFIEKADYPSIMNNSKSDSEKNTLSETTINLLNLTIYVISSAKPLELPIPIMTTGIKVLQPRTHNNEISLIGFKVFNQRQVAANILYTYRLHKNFGLYTGFGISRGHYRFDKIPKDFPASMHHMPSINKVAYGTQEFSIPIGIEGKIKLGKMSPYTRLAVQFATNTARDIAYEHIDIHMGENKIEKMDRRHTNKELQYQFALGLSTHLTHSILIRGEFLYSSDFKREINFKSHSLQAVSGLGIGVSYIL